MLNFEIQNAYDAEQYDKQKNERKRNCFLSGESPDYRKELFKNKQIFNLTRRNMRKIFFEIDTHGMRKTITTLLTSILLCCAATVAAQNVTVSGVITDESGEALIGVNVQVKGTTQGTITDVDGKYSVPVPGAQSVLVFSYVGYATQEITVGAQRTVNVTLRDDSRSLEEIVVVGYGVQKKLTVTGSVTTVTGEELKASPTTNLSNAMIGRMPGVIAFQRSDEPGGGGSTIRIRGTNSLGSKDPLYVIDGIPDRTGGMNRLNPNEIESMSVLKDAAAAIYGSRAANGVILITTKKGKEGKPTVSFNGTYGFSQPTRLPKMANSYEYATMLNEITPGTYTQEELQKFQDGSDQWGYPDTDWFKESIKPVSPMYRVDIGVNGGTDKMKYYVNAAANGEDGVYKNSSNRYDQYSLRANLDFKLSQYVSATVGTVARMEDTQYPAKSAGSIFSALRRGKPIYRAFWPTGEPGPDIEYGDNPAITGSDASGFDRQKNYYMQNNAGLVIDIPWIQGLKLVGNGSYDKRFYNRNFFSKPVVLYAWDGENRSSAGLAATERWIADPRLQRESDDYTDWMVNSFLSYDRTFGKHNVTVSVGIEAQSKSFEHLMAYRRYYSSDAITEINLGSAVDQNMEGYSWKEARLNYFGRVGYNYLERYLLEFVWRADGSYRFPSDKRYGFFPGIMGAWRVSEENFWKENVKVIDYFKLRASVSQTGMDVLLDGDSDVDRSIQYMTTYAKQTDGYIIAGNEEPRYYPSRTPNPGITWEVGTTYNVGADFKFLENRLSLEGDVFYHKRTSMLISRFASMPEIAGITLPRENLGEMANKGFDALIGWEDKAGDFGYNLALNLSYAKAKILYWDEEPNIPDYQLSTGKVPPTGNSYAALIAREGLYYLADGIYHTQAEVDNSVHWEGAVPGDVKFVDVNGDGVIDGNDRVRRNKNEEPTFVFGFNLGFSYKNWDLMCLLQGATGSERYIRTWSGTVGNFLKEYYDNRWTPETPDRNGPRTYERENQYWCNVGSTFFLYSADYLRLKNLELGYTFAPSLLRKANISNLRIFANAQNLLTFDHLKGMSDPEGTDSSIASYPQRKYVNFGITATF
jgi:TonB-linked SusC/RagA family outer membrane protein